MTMYPGATTPEFPPQRFKSPPVESRVAEPRAIPLDPTPFPKAVSSEGTHSHPQCPTNDAAEISILLRECRAAIAMFQYCAQFMPMCLHPYFYASQMGPFYAPQRSMGWGVQPWGQRPGDPNLQLAMGQQLDSQDWNQWLRYGQQMGWCAHPGVQPQQSLQSPTKNSPFLQRDLGVEKEVRTPCSPLSPVTEAIGSCNSGNFLKCDSAEEVQKIFRQVMSGCPVFAKVLGVFDIHYVLGCPVNPETHPLNKKEHQGVYGGLFKGFSSQLKDLIHFCSNDCKNVDVDRNMSSILKALQDEGVPMVALTASLAGKDAKNPVSLEVRKLGYDFSRTSPAIEELYFDGARSYLDSIAHHDRGVISANGSKQKGKVFKLYLEEMQRRGMELPETIIVVDDTPYNLEDIQKVLLESFPKINCIPILFSKNTPCETMTEEQFVLAWSRHIDEASRILESMQIPRAA